LLDQQDVGLFEGEGTMLNTLGNDKHLARSEYDDTIAQLNAYTVLESQKEVISIVATIGLGSNRVG